VVNETSAVSSDLWTTAVISLPLEFGLDRQQKDFAGYCSVEFGSRLSHATISGAGLIYPREHREDDAINLVVILKRVLPLHNS
jgi:hypothetical protein